MMHEMSLPTKTTCKKEIIPGHSVAFCREGDTGTSWVYIKDHEKQEEVSSVVHKLPLFLHSLARQAPAPAPAPSSPSSFAAASSLSFSLFSHSRASFAEILIDLTQEPLLSLSLFSLLLL